MEIVINWIEVASTLSKRLATDPSNLKTAFKAFEEMQKQLSDARIYQEELIENPSVTDEDISKATQYYLFIVDKLRKRRDSLFLVALRSCKASLAKLDKIKENQGLVDQVKDTIEETQLEQVLGKSHRHVLKSLLKTIEKINAN